MLLLINYLLNKYKTLMYLMKKQKVIDFYATSLKYQLSFFVQ